MEGMKAVAEMMKQSAQAMRRNRAIDFLVAKGYCDTEATACFKFDTLSTDLQIKLMEDAAQWEKALKSKQAEEEQRAEEERKKSEKRFEYENSFLPSIPDIYRDADIAQYTGRGKKYIVDEGRNCLLVGTNGTGKTRFGWAVTKYYKRDTEKTVRFIKAARLLSGIKSCIASNVDIFEVIESEYGKKLDVLIIDEIDKVFASKAEYVYLSHLIDFRYEWRKQTVVMGNCSEESFRNALGSSMYSRLAGTADGGSCIVFNGEDKRFADAPRGRQ